ncbi:hypothetical protein B0A48_14412 [Cryoendolithus antarcticus]|uniref:FAD-binding PCMH-type domain-containing protein n=1 Tax=Cryoendolithus antarcticus TaxID=1507870 RepID=A0A1V8SJW1_9PEZI|nr:hypothetical protein B0A48_14412 [Cryoendolithus antarcticus]
MLSPQTVASGLLAASLCVPVAAAPPFFNPFMRHNLAATLGPQLSSGAALYTKSNSDFAKHDERWTQWNAPTFSAVVEPASEKDIVATIQYATSNGIPFFAQGGGHGYSGTLGIIQKAIMIKLQTNFGSALYNAHDKSVSVGGGAKYSVLAEAAYAAGRELTVGSCPCVGAVGGALSGGHGRLQGKHGLGLDALKSMRVVLANGTALDVSAEKNVDLWWGMRGAGQNYGVVVSATFNTFPETPGAMHYDGELILDGTQLEEVFEILNEMVPTWPAGLAFDVLFAAFPGSLDPVIVLSMIYAGPKREAAKYTHRFAALKGSLMFSENMYTWADLPFKAAGGSIAASCGTTKLRSTYSNNVRTFDPKIQRDAWNKYGEFLQAYPNANGTGVLWEIFGTQRVSEIPANASSYAFRDRVTMIGLLQFDYTDPSILPGIEAYGKAWRQQSIENSGWDDDKLYVYPNYARGDEPLDSLFGYEHWRIEKLRMLKKEYDPTDAFRGYHDVWSHPGKDHHGHSERGDLK